MKVSYNWLKNYANLTQTPDEISALLTDCGLEVESVDEIESVRGGLKGVVIGEVKTCEKHPDADKLSITTVDVGAENLLNIVCGAPNVAAGQKVAVATIGTKLYSGDEVFEIKKSKIRGVTSEGMICAEDELGLGASHDGIMVLKPETRVGMPAAEYFNIESDFVFTIGLTPNRGDAASHVGVVRDLVACINVRNRNQNLKINYPDISNFDKQTASGKLNIPVIVENAEACPRYSGVSMQGVTVKPSPDWLKNKLMAIGVRPINNIVDITNYILMELGQPMHAFDAAEIKGGKVIVKNLAEKTPFVTLDCVKRELSAKDLMICNAEEGMCIAGVFGGEKSGITEKTTDIFLESAYFNPVSVRKTARFHGLSTDASFRFERGTDPNITVYALKRAALLVQELAGGTIASEVYDVYPSEIKPKEVVLNLSDLARQIGEELPIEDIKNILSSLEIPILEEKNNEFRLAIPTNKHDVIRSIDVTEEILRIYSYNRLKRLGSITLTPNHAVKPDAMKLYNRVADLLSNNGFAEIMNNSLTKADYYSKNPGFSADELVHIANPLSNELDVMRQTLLFGGLESIAYNQNRKATDLKLYEFGNVYAKNLNADPAANVIKRYKEERRLGVFLCGNETGESWEQAQEKVDFFTLKSFVNLIFQNLRISKISVNKEVSSIFSNGLSYSINNKIVAEFGQIKTEILKNFDIKQSVFFADIRWTEILKAVPTKAVSYQEISKFPDVRRDLSLLLDKNIDFKQLEDLAFECDKKILQKVNLFDVYEGDKLPEGKKSYAVSFTFQDREKTLTDVQIDKIMEKLVKAYGEKLSAVLR